MYSKKIHFFANSKKKCHKCHKCHFLYFLVIFITIININITSKYR